MLGRQDRDEVRQLIYQELAALESRVCQCAGSYNYMCLVGGSPCFTHQPVGPVLRTIPHV